MFSGKKLTITAKGLKEGLTDTEDGIAFFGSSDKKNVKKYHKNTIKFYIIFLINLFYFF
jgi:hypothetical protein